MTDAALVGAPRFSRLDRRKAGTRQALVDAAVQLIAQGPRGPGEHPGDHRRG
jgi:hypothetical protein